MTDRDLILFAVERALAVARTGALDDDDDETVAAWRAAELALNLLKTQLADLTETHHELMRTIGN